VVGVMHRQSTFSRLMERVQRVYLLNGYALNTGGAAQGMLKRVAPARIACLDVNLQQTIMQMGIQVLVTDTRELEKIHQQ